MVDMTMQLQTGTDKFLYEQIYEHIRKEIRGGKLLQGEKLPSTRVLAEYLQVSRSTIDFAYGQLLAEGYIESQPHRGYYVCRMEELYRIQTEPSRKAERKEASSVSYTYDFSPNGIDMSGFPFGTWKKINKNILTYANKELFSSGSPQGDIDLRITVAGYLHSSRGVNCLPEQIIVGAGNDYLLMLLEKILGRHVRIAMENPTYKRAYKIFQSFAYQIRAIDMDESGMQAGFLRESDAAVAYVMPSHQYPTGTVMPIGRRTELLNWANEQQGRYLIEDDYDSEFRYKGKPVPSLQATDMNGKVIYIGTFSKAIAPAIRVSYMVLPYVLLEEYRRSCHFYSSTVSRIDQRILNEFISGGYFERYLNKARKIYKEKHDRILELLKPFMGHFAVEGENAGLHILLRSTRGKTEEELLLCAEKAGVKVYGLSDAYIGEGKQDTSNTVLLGYGGLTKRQIEEGMALLENVWLN